MAFSTRCALRTRLPCITRQRGQGVLCREFGLFRNKPGTARTKTTACNGIDISALRAQPLRRAPHFFGMRIATAASREGYLTVIATPRRPRMHSRGMRGQLLARAEGVGSRRQSMGGTSLASPRRAETTASGDGAGSTPEVRHMPAASLCCGPPIPCMARGVTTKRRATASAAARSASAQRFVGQIGVTGQPCFQCVAQFLRALGR